MNKIQEKAQEKLEERHYLTSNETAQYMLNSCTTYNFEEGAKWMLNDILDFLKNNIRDYIYMKHVNLDFDLLEETIRDKYENERPDNRE